ncbi:class I SAM-dependent methyltransferase [Gulosibacter sp. 10]|uniref:class I SAM-dependent methyltransferase n=1 Tax=Gulosibacter sp. 10 TaxID=1255570 RepID=UPI00097F495B|nr:class I SAM-dependent methyltransferase [Gulosibacter sp. 10]SJM56022.1 2-heptaprenyl-1,4-naphthoquinone methyltransferase MenG [Gulosibacter sp. 10]
MTKVDLEKRPADVSSMFDRVSRKYDLTNDVLTAGIAPYWRARTRQAIDPRPGQRVLDVACGTGTVSRILADHGAEVTGLDFSKGMIEEGIRRHGDHPNIAFQQGDATDLPFEDGSFDVTTVSFGIRNVQRPEKALAEMLRVTRPGGRIVVCEFSRPTNAVIGWGYDTYMNVAMPGIVKLVSSDPEAYDYLFKSIQDWPDQRTFASWLREAGYEQVAHRNLAYGIVALHRGVKPIPTTAQESN